MSFVICDLSFSDDNDRFSGRLANNDRVSHAEVAWDDGGDPKLKGRNLLDDGNPFRWILDESIPPVAPPRAFVEFVGGDRMPGTVVGVGRNEGFTEWPEHLVVEPSVLLDDPAHQRLTSVRVTTATIARIAWDAPKPRDLRPGTVFHRDGRETTFRSLRWGDGTLRVLTPKGLETIPTGAIAEVHLPARDPWEVYAREVAVLSPRLEDLLIRWETRGGLVVTGSESRYEAGHRGDKRNHENWFHRVQPTWSLDPFWIRFDGVRSVRIWRPDEVPLSRLRPVSVRRSSVFGSSWEPTTDASVRGTALRSGDQPFGWGLGVHARTELAFDLPPYATEFESDLGLDEVVGAGGAVKFAVHASTEPATNDPGRRVHESPLVVGSNEVRSTGRIDVRPLAKEGRRLILVADMAHGEQPSGGDPFDVRDSADWLDPLLRLDRDALLAAVRTDSNAIVPVLADWEPGGESPVLFGSYWLKSDPYDPRYVVETSIDGPYASWSRSLDFDETDRWLAIGVHRHGDDNDPETSIQVRFDGRAVGEFPVPRWSDEWGPNSVLVPLDDEFRGREVAVELRVMPRKPGEAFVVWRGVDPVVHPPHLLRVFDEELDFPNQLTEGDGEAIVTLEEARRGEASLIVSGEGRGRVDLLDASIRVRPRVGEYRYLRFSWRKDGGRRIAIRVGHDGEFGVVDDGVRPRIVRESAGAFAARRHQERDRRGEEVGYTYDSSASTPNDKAALRIDKKPPEEWRVVQRDLFSDFGEFRLTGFSFEALDGEAAYFDEVYLARKGSDFSDLDRPPYPTMVPPEYAALEEDPWRFRRVLNDFAPDFSSIELGYGARLLKEYRGRENVLRTFGPDHNRSAILRRPFVVPAGRTKLVLDVSRDDDKEWRLDVHVNGDRVLSEVVGRNLKRDDAGWGRFEVDLSEHAGRPIVLSIAHARHGGSREVGYFGAIRLETN